MASSDWREVHARERSVKEDWGDGFACAKPEPPGPPPDRFVRSDSKSVGSSTHALLHVRQGCVGQPSIPVDSPVSYGSFALANDSGDPRVLWAHQRLRVRRASDPVICMRTHRQCQPPCQSSSSPLRVRKRECFRRCDAVSAQRTIRPREHGCLMMCWCLRPRRVPRVKAGAQETTSNT